MGIIDELLEYKKASQNGYATTCDVDKMVHELLETCEYYIDELNGDEEAEIVLRNAFEDAIITVMAGIKKGPEIVTSSDDVVQEIERIRTRFMSRPGVSDEMTEMLCEAFDEVVAAVLQEGR